MANQFILDDQIITYMIFDDGYDIYLDGSPFITQREPYIPKRNMSYEENAVSQIEELIESYNNSQKNRIIEESKENDIDAMLVDHEYRLTLVELDV